MKKAIRCCISCIFPCGALDVIRIVHVNGRVEEITGGNIRAAEVMKAHPKHVLKKPITRPVSDFDDPNNNKALNQQQPTIVVVPPDALLQRGKIYFLIPVVGPTPMSAKKKAKSSASIVSSSPSTARRKRRDQQQQQQQQRINGNGSGGNNSISVRANRVWSDQYLCEILSEKVSSQRERRRGRVGVWRPHLESICESLSEVSSTDK